MKKSEDEMSEEECRLLELLSILIDEYQNRAHPLPKAEPHKMLAYLLGEKNRKPSDLWSVRPNRRVSEFLNGKRSINKAQARQLAELLRVPPRGTPSPDPLGFIASWPEWIETPRKPYNRMACRRIGQRREATRAPC